MDIESLSKKWYMLVVSSDTSESDRKEVKKFIENYDTILLESNTDADTVRNVVENGLEAEDPIIVVEEYHLMSEDVQKFISQYLKGIAEEYVDVPIIVYDSEGENLVHQNPDLSLRLYTL